MVVYVRRFIFNCRNPDNRNKGPISVEEFVDGETCIIKLIQQETFAGVCDKRLVSLRPFEDNNGVIRLKTKVSERVDLNEFRYPAVLPQKHVVVARLIYYLHVESSHVGIQGLINMLRERFWIINARRAVRSVISRCVICRRYDARKLESFPVSLPEHRVREAAVFEITGVDFAGPIFLKGRLKAWICLFTCAVYRAIHLELVTNLSTDGFLQAFRRFIARRGRPVVMCSDQGTNFVGTDNAFNHLNWTEITEFSTVRRIKWKFNPPSAAWWGGWWERLIRIVKQLLRKILGKSCLSYEEMNTILCDSESIINARPLTYISEDSADLIALTPAIFLQDIREAGVPDIDKLESVDLSRRWHYRQKLRNDLRRRFRIEYLGQLMQHSRKTGYSRRIKVGEIVLIGSDNSKRIDWPLGRVEELIPGQDGEVRVVRLKTAGGQVMRPLQRLYPLEIESAESVGKNIPQNNDGQQTMPACIVDDDENIDDLESTQDRTVVVTRFGRRVRFPSRYPTE